jgi:wobble nucleotide-excising tRNase
LPALPAGFAELLAKTIDDITKDAEDRIKTHLAAHSMADAGWIAQGFDHADDMCPFCGQEIQGLPLLAAYQSVFSESYRELRGAVAAMKTAVGQAFGETALAKLETLAEQHKGGIEFWSKYCQVDAVAIAYPGSIHGAIKALGAAALELIERKSREPLEDIPADDPFLDAVGVYQSEQTKVYVLNQAIRLANELISTKKTESGVTDVEAATAELAHLKATKIRYGTMVAELCKEYIRLTGEKAELEKFKNTVRRELDTYTESVVKPYQNRINELLDGFNTGFMIDETKHSYAGGVATSSYQLVINQTAVEIGGGNTPNHVPSFKNTLSAGDRATLALAFFLADLERDKSASRKTVVFDDPFNSQDAFRRRQTIHEIMKIARQCAQVLVLSHDATFLKQIWDKSPASERAALTLADHGQMGSKIAECDLEKACQGRTATDMDDLQSYVTSGAGAHIDIIRKMRTVLETYMRSFYPRCCDDRDWLGDIVRKIREGGAEHPAAHMYDQLNQINDYTAQYHHGENVADGTPDFIDANELRGFARRTLRMVNALQA